MKQNTVKLLIGLIIIIVGLNLILHAANVKFTLFFNGWWTIPLIIIAISSMLKDGIKLGNFGFLIVGLWLLATQRGWTPEGLPGKSIAGGVIIVLGLLFIFSPRTYSTTNSKTDRRSHNPHSRAESANTTTQESTSSPSYTAIFSGQEIRNTTDALDGCTMLALFGGLSADFRNAQIKSDIMIDASAFFGGIELHFPPTVRVVTKATPLFGGVDNKTHEPFDSNAPTVTVRCLAVFGGVDIT